MIEMLVSGLLCLATMAVLLGLLALVVRAQILHYNATVAAERLDSWERHLQGLDPERSARARANPPAAVLDALVGLPAKGRGSLRTGWREQPLPAAHRPRPEL